MRISDWSSDVCSSDLAVAACKRRDVERGAQMPDRLLRADAAVDGRELPVGTGIGHRQVRRRAIRGARLRRRPDGFGCRSEEHTSELQSLMRISYAVFCLKKKKHHRTYRTSKS